MSAENMTKSTEKRQSKQNRQVIISKSGDSGETRVTRPE